MSVRTETREKFLNALQSSGKVSVSKSEIESISDDLGIKVPQWFLKEPSNRAARGMYWVPNLSAKVLPMPKQPEVQDEPKKVHRISNVTTDLETENLIPTVYKNYVSFGNFDDIFNIIKSEQFFPVFITGHSGNGKTMSIEQACAKAKRSSFAYP